ncbi:glycogen-binding domain-containing protein [Thermococcus peptonophilus]|uniref:glycogen-binding domain-containing protein n=1 Tax=Thermococcus peptonophilus TaxID=53952 RepID=UPI000B06488B
MKKGSLLLILLLLASVASGCISESHENQPATTSTVPPTSIPSSQSSTSTASTSTYGPSEKTELGLPSVNYTPIYIGIEKGCPSGRVPPVKFTYNPPGNRTVKSVSLRGSFNDWGGEWPMGLKNGTWRKTVCLRPGRYEYKYFINGQWVKDMSDDGTGKPYDPPDADAYAPDGYGGKNAVRVVDGHEVFYVEFDPKDPAYLSIADNRTVVRFEVKRDTVESAVLVTDHGNYTMRLQLWWDSSEMWRAEMPVEPADYYILITSSDGEKFAVLDTSETPFFHFDGVEGGFPPAGVGEQRDNLPDIP